jgi:hypothetical protein
MQNIFEGEDYSVDEENGIIETKNVFIVALLKNSGITSNRNKIKDGKVWKSFNLNNIGEFNKAKEVINRLGDSDTLECDLKSFYYLSYLPISKELKNSTKGVGQKIKDKNLIVLEDSVETKCAFTMALFKYNGLTTNENIDRGGEVWKIYRFHSEGGVRKAKWVLRNISNMGTIFGKINHFYNFSLRPSLNEFNTLIRGSKRKGSFYTTNENYNDSYNNNHIFNNHKDVLRENIEDF